MPLCSAPLRRGKKQEGKKHNTHDVTNEKEQALWVCGWIGANLTSYTRCVSVVRIYKYFDILARDLLILLIIRC